jgi:Tfp pilus assembly protein PilO
MKPTWSKENILTIGGTMLAAGFFVFGIYLPGERACEAARREIATASQAIESMPRLIQESSDRLEQEARHREALQTFDRLLDDEQELDVVLQRVAYLAQAAGLKLDRIQPLSAVLHQTYRVVPYQLTVTGSFRRIAEFLHGLESQTTLFAVERLQLRHEADQASDQLRADLTFSVFVKRTSFADFTEKNDSQTLTQADETRR